MPVIPLPRSGDSSNAWLREAIASSRAWRLGQVRNADGTYGGIAPVRAADPEQAEPSTSPAPAGPVMPAGPRGESILRGDWLSAAARGYYPN